MTSPSSHLNHKHIHTFGIFVLQTYVKIFTDDINPLNNSTNYLHFMPHFNIFSNPKLTLIHTLNN